VHWLGQTGKLMGEGNEKGVMWRVVDGEIWDHLTYNVVNDIFDGGDKENGDKRDQCRDPR